MCFLGARQPTSLDQRQDGTYRTRSVRAASVRSNETCMWRSRINWCKGRLVPELSSAPCSSVSGQPIQPRAGRKPTCPSTSHGSSGTGGACRFRDAAVSIACGSLVLCTLTGGAGIQTCDSRRSRRLSDSSTPVSDLCSRSLQNAGMADPADSMPLSALGSHRSSPAQRSPADPSFGINDAIRFGATDPSGSDPSQPYPLETLQQFHSNIHPDDRDVSQASVPQTVGYSQFIHTTPSTSKRDARS